MNHRHDPHPAASAPLAEDGDALLRQICGALTDVVWLMEWPGKRLLYVNPAYELLTGHSCQSMLEGRPHWPELIHEDHRQRVLEQFERDAPLGQFEAEFHVIRADGRLRWVRARAFAIHDAAGNVVRIAGRTEDLTERRQNDRELQIARLTMDSAGDAVYWVHSDGPIFYANQAACRQLGYERSQLLSLRTFDIAPNLTDERWANQWRRLRQEGTMTFETVHRRRDGQVFPVEITASHIVIEGQEYSCAIVRDITERKNEQERATVALNAAREGAWDWDLVTNAVVYNDQWYRMLGYEPGEEPMTFDTWAKLVHPDDLPMAMRAIEDHLADRTPHYEAEIRMRQKDGQWRWLLTTGKVTQRDGPRPIRMSGVHVDIEMMKRTQHALAEAKASAEAAARAKSQFVATISHEIRTPLNAIVGYADLLSRHDADPDEARDWADQVRRNADHLSSLVNDVLDLSRIEAGQLNIRHGPCSLRHVVEDVLLLLKRQADEKLLPLEVVYDGPLPQRIETDADRFRQILINLVSNAIKFTDEGEVKIVLRCVRSVERGRRELAIEVRDTGIGIAPDRLGDIFDAFVQVHDRREHPYGGTGLGLAICHRLAELLGGEIRVQSQPGKGSVFTLRLPIDDEAELMPMPTDPASPRRHDESRGQGELADVRILVADDNRDNRRLLEYWLVEAGAAVRLCPNGLVAVRTATDARAAGEPFDAILMDMQMPVMDGYEATRQLRDLGAPEPIIAVTAYATTDDRDRCLAAGCREFLTKPVDRRRLIRTLRRLVLGVEDGSSSHYAAADDDHRNSEDNAGFADLIEDYRCNLRHRLDAVRQAVDRADLPVICTIAHQLKGTGSNFGYPGITRAAGACERVIEAALVAQSPDSEQWKSAVSGLLHEIESALRLPPGG